MKKTITFFSRRAAMMLLATLLLALTAQTAKAGAYDVLYAVVSDTDNDGVNETMTLKCASSFPSGNNRYQYNQHWTWAESFRAPITTITVDASCANYTGTTMNGLFYRFANATVINDLDKLRTDDVTNMQDVFQYCQKVTTLDGINAWNTAKVTTMQNLFYNCRAVTKLDLSGWNTAAVTDMSSMFAACVELLSLDLSGWNTASVTTMSDMFGSCKKLTTLDLADFNTAKVTDMTVMFDGCSGLQTILVGSGWTTAAVTTSINMFRSCSVTLTGGNGTKWNSSNIDATYAVVDGLNSQSGYLTGEWTLFNTGDDADHAYVIGSKALFDLFSRRVNAGNSYAGKYFKLGANLTYNKYYANIFTPIGTASHPFSGTFDGNYNGVAHTISGINISLGTTDYVGLFGEADGATIKNLTVANSTISGKGKVGAILGSSHTDNNATIENCLVTSDVTVSGTEYVGGIVGNKANITGCASAATVSGDSRVGGIIGNGHRSIVTNCLYTGNSVSGSSYVGAIVGNDPSSTLNSNYNYYMSCTVAGVPNATNVGCNGSDINGARKALAIGAAADVTVTPVGAETTYDVSNITVYADNSGMSYGGNWYAGATETVKASIAYTSPYETFIVTGYNDGNGNALTYVSGTTYTLTMPATVPTVTPDGRDLWGEMFSGRDGLTAATAYLITTTEGLDLLAKKVNGTDGYTVNNYSGKFFELGEDITYDNTQENNYTAIGTYTSYSVNQPFCGKFDGKGHTVSGIRINKTAYYQGLFGYINGAEVKNLIIDDATITIGSGNNCAGGIAGFSALSTIENCHATSTVTVIAQTGGTNGTDVGGIVGRNATNTGTISGCTSAATVSGNSHVGAIVGRNMYATIENCLVLDANVTADDVAGAIAGMNSGTLTNNRYTSGTSVNGGSPIGHGTGESGDITDNGGATVAYEFPISIDEANIAMGNVGTTYGTGDYTGITAYGTNGLYYKGHLYYPSLWSGTGTSAEDPYVIYNTEGLDKLASDVNGGNKYKNTHFALGTDITYDKTALTIDFNDDGTNDSNFRGIGDKTYEYYGNFDGRGHTISGLVINKPNDNYYVGLFGRNYSEYVKNLTVANSDITGQNDVGAIVGGANNGLTIENCHVASDVTVTGRDYLGGIAGYLGNVKGCTSAATVSGRAYVGGIIGFQGGSTVRDCLYLGTSVTATGTNPYVAAIIGQKYDGTTANNYHTYYRLGGINFYNSTASFNIDGAQFAVSSTSAPDEATIGTAGAAYAAGTTYEGITPYTNGLYYNGRYYWHEAVIELADQGTTNSDVISSNNDGQTHNVVLKDRTLYRDGYWNTLCLPFDVTVGSDVMADATAMTLNTSTSGFNESTGELTLYFDDAPTTIPAGTPFIVKWGNKNSHPDTDITDPVFSGVTISSTTPTLIKSTDTNVGFIGNYNRVTLTGGDASNLYLGVKDGKSTLFWPSSDRQINAFRAYFIIYPLQSGGGQAPELKIVLNFGEEGETTGIVTMSDVRSKMSDVWYTLDGRKLDGKPTQKGLYIVNGKKVVIK